LRGAVLAFVMPTTLWLYVPTYQPTDEASQVAYARELSQATAAGDRHPDLQRR